MRILISPAKKMNDDPDVFEVWDLPRFLDETKVLLDWMQGQSFRELQELWKCNDRLAELNFERVRQMDLTHNLTPALVSYEGIQYQYMAPKVFMVDQLAYVQEYLRILSGFYGLLRPLDGVTPYRLEMQARVTAGGARDLYEFWGDRIYRSLIGEDAERTILNLASKEYAKCVEAYLQPEDTFITFVFGELKDGRVLQKGTQAKMARGEMVRYLSEFGIEDPEEAKGFDRLGYRFRPELSTDTEYVFLFEGTGK